MGQIASGQITITDLNDGRTFISQIKDNLNSGGYFAYDPDTDSYSPNLKAAGITLTAELFTTTNGTNLFPTGNSDITVANVQWYKSGAVLTGKTSNVLTLTSKEIFPDKNSPNTVNYTLKFTVKENIFGITAPNIPMEQNFTFNRVKQGSGANYVLLNSTPSGMFVNAADSDEITINASPFANGIPITSQPSIKYWKWEYFDDATKTFKEINVSNYPNGTWNSLTISKNEVFGSEVFRYSYDFSEGATPNFTKAVVTSTIIIDYTDPITVTVTSNAGDVFKPGMGNKLLVANVYEKIGDRHELIEDPQTKYSFSWASFDKDGSPTTSPEFTTPDAAKPHQIQITPANINVSGTYIVSVEKKVSAARAAMAENYGFRANIIQ